MTESRRTGKMELGGSGRAIRMVEVDRLRIGRTWTGNGWTGKGGTSRRRECDDCRNSMHRTHRMSI